MRDKSRSGRAGFPRPLHPPRWRRSANARTRAYREALAIHRETGDRRFTGIHLCDLAELGRKADGMGEACRKAGIPAFEGIAP